MHSVAPSTSVSSSLSAPEQVLDCPGSFGVTNSMWVFYFVILFFFLHLLSLVPVVVAAVWCFCSSSCTADVLNLFFGNL
jgi:hypothetical protein